LDLVDEVDGWDEPTEPAGILDDAPDSCGATTDGFVDVLLDFVSTFARLDCEATLA